MVHIIFIVYRYGGYVKTTYTRIGSIDNITLNYGEHGGFNSSRSILCYYYIAFWPNRPIVYYCDDVYLMPIRRQCTHENQTRAYPVGPTKYYTSDPGIFFFSSFYPKGGANIIRFSPFDSLKFQTHTSIIHFFV